MHSTHPSIQQTMENSINYLNAMSHDSGLMHTPPTSPSQMTRQLPPLPIHILPLFAAHATCSLRSVSGTSVIMWLVAPTSQRSQWPCPFLTHSHHHIATVLH